MTWSRFFAVTILALVFATSAWTPTASSSQRAYVDAAVATVWTSPAAPRAIDRPALRNPVGLHSWNRSLNTLARRGLVGRIQTQALYGEGVEVLGHRGSWTHVTVSDQPTPRNSRGYPGWIPTAQLTAGRRFGALPQGRTAVVVRPTAVLRGVGGLLELSYGTRLPLLGTVGSDLLVLTPDGRTGRLPRNAVSTLELAGKKRQASGRKIVSAARMFLRVRYLWGGASAFGFDCSGLIEVIFRTAGFVIPRDADAQALGGHRVARSRILPGDLLFYGRRHVHHVTLYVGSGTMIEAPNSASSVHLSPVRSADYAAARRYIRP